VADFFDEHDGRIRVIRDFLTNYDKNNASDKYDDIEEFCKLISDITSYSSKNMMVDAIINGADSLESGSMSEQIRDLFVAMFPDCELKKIEFDDEYERKIFINYDTQ